MISGSIRIDQLSSNIVDFSSVLDSFILREDTELSNDINTTSNNFYSNILLESEDIDSNIDETSNNLYDIVSSESIRLSNSIDTTSNNLYSHIDTEYNVMSNGIDTKSNSLYDYIDTESITLSNSINNTLDIIHGIIESDLDPLSNSINTTSNNLYSGVLSEYAKLDSDFGVIPVRFNNINATTLDVLNSLKEPEIETIGGITHNRVQLYIEETIILSEELANYTLNTGKLLDSQKNITKLNVLYYGLITDDTLTIDANDLPLSITEIEIIVKNNDLRPQFTITISGFKEILTITIINEREYGGRITIDNQNNVTCIYQDLNNNDVETITIDQVTEHYVLDTAKILGSPRELNVMVNAILYSSKQSEIGNGLTINFGDLLDSIKIIKIFVKANIYGSGGNGGFKRNDIANSANGVDGGDAIHIDGGDSESNGKICYIYTNNDSLKGGGGGGAGITNFSARGAHYNSGEVSPASGSNGGDFNSGGGNSGEHEGGAAGKRVNNGSKATVVLIDEDNTNTPVLNFTGQHRTLVKLTNPMSKYGYIVSASNKYYKKNKTKGIDIIESLPIVDLSKTIKDKKVFGVISDKVEVNVKVENKYETSINSVGEGAIWVCDIKGNLENGDYITSSVIPGIGMKQDDNLLHNYTVAKITMNCDFNPQYVEVKTLKKDKDSSELIKELVYDNENNIMYEYEYMLKYIRLNGEIIDKSTYELELASNLEVYKMAFVGCTYHCG